MFYYVLIRNSIVAVGSFMYEFLSFGYKAMAGKLTTWLKNLPFD